MPDQIVSWKEKALDFLIEIGSFHPHSDADAYRRELLVNLKKYTECDAIFLTKKMDNVAEMVLVSSDLTQEGKFTETSFLATSPDPEACFSFHQKVSVPNRSHILKGISSCIYVPLVEVHYQGAIVLSWEKPFLITEGLEMFLNISSTRIRELMKLNASYLAVDELRVKFDAVFHTVSQALIFMDDTGKNAWLNHKAKQLLSIKAKEEELAPAIVAKGMQNLREKAQNAKEINTEAEDLFRHPEKEITNWIWKFAGEVFRVSSIPTISKHVKGRLWVFEDISQMYFANRQLNRFNQELYDANEELNTTLAHVSAQKDLITQQNNEIQFKNDKLEIVNQEKNNLIGIVSHDLRAPLLQIKGFTDIILFDNETLNKDQQFCIEKIQVVTERGLSLINDLLDISAIEQQQTKKNLVSLNIKDALSGEMDALRMMAGKKQINIHFSSEVGHYIILADKVFFHRIIDNLFSNAVKFSYPNASVYVSIRNEDGRLVIAVRDEGQGIKETDKPHLFGKFKRLSAKPTGDESSTGLGLSIVKMLVEELNGNISCASEWQRGATFTVSFPLQEQ